MSNKNTTSSNPVYISNFTVVKSDSGDYEAVYAGDRLLLEAPRIRLYDLLNALGFDVKMLWVSDDETNSLPDRLSELFRRRKEGAG